MCARTCSTPTRRGSITYLDDAARAAERGFKPAFAENAAIAAGYWPMLATEYEELRGPEARAKTDRDFAQMQAAAARGDVDAFTAARDLVLSDVDGFTAAPLHPRRAGLGAPSS